MKKRTDISKYLIHSVRRPLVNDFPQEGEEELYFPLINDLKVHNDSKDSIFSSLINIIKEGGLRASRSFRKRKATVYGGDPVVCLTEMPLINFIQYIKDRNDKYKFSEYGIAILKKEAFKNKGRPVISGLSYDNKFEFENNDKRILHPNILPYKEQYRYVKLDLVNGTDWTHEREWRIKCEYDKKHFHIKSKESLDVYMTWGVNMFSDIFYSETIIILKTKEEAVEIQQIVQKQLDNGYSKGGEEFYNKIKYLIIDKAVEYLENNSLTRIEDLPIDTFYKHVYEEITENEKKEIKEIIQECTNLGSYFSE